MLDESRLGSRFEVRGREGVGWVETDLGGHHRVAFFLRSRPGAEPAGRSLDLGTTNRVPSPGQTAARSALCDAIGLGPDQVRLARQVHGTDLVDLRGGSPEPEGASETLAESALPQTEADGFLLGVSDRETAALIVTADCLPVALWGSGGVALVHLGWRGLAGGLLERAVGEVDPVDAVIGPGIGPCCYEVGNDVTDALGLGVEPGPVRIDLTALVIERLERAGVARIDSTGLCTCCEKELLFSHRRDGGASGRQGTVIFPR